MHRLCWRPLTRPWCGVWCSLRTRGWQDPESDLPLSYSFSAGDVELVSAVSRTTITVSEFREGGSGSMHKSAGFSVLHANIACLLCRPGTVFADMMMSTCVPIIQAYLPVSSNLTLAVEASDSLGASATAYR